MIAARKERASLGRAGFVRESGTGDGTSALAAHPLDREMATSFEVSVVLPTLNERECLELLYKRLDAALAPYSHEIVVVDDQSPDGTGELVRRLAASGPYRLISRVGRTGLSSAVLEGFLAARGRILVVMDADGSHPPELLPDLIAPIRLGRAEFVLASRRVRGGADGGLRSVRWLTSWAATLPARPLTPVHDPMSGFFAVPTDVLGRSSLSPTGFKIALEILVKCRPAPVLEVPFHFGERLAGESKLGPKVIASYGWHLMRLYTWRFAHAGAAPTKR